MYGNVSRPGSMLILTFLFLCITGAALLLLPGMHRTGLSPVDALFTSVSAVCVTGLATVATSGFTHMGQGVLLVLMQIGALGIMTLTSGIMLALRGELDFRERLHVSVLNESQSLREVEGVLWVVLRYTFVVEVIGFVPLFIGFIQDGHTVSASAWYALFHAISAFCNAGFSPFDDSLMSAGSVVQVTVMLLIICGGLGYYVAFDLERWVSQRKRLTLHSRLVLIGTGVFILFGAVFLFISERGHMSVLDALFQSVTCRTAGFNTVDMAKMYDSAIPVMLVLMIVGAAPGSTGGGVKLTTVIVSFFALTALLQGKERVVAYGRQISTYQAVRGLSLLFLYCLVLLLATYGIMLLEPISLKDGLFEVTSALGTVGLSLGITPYLSAGGKMLIIVTMFTGRVGPAMLVVFFMRQQESSRIAYPEEKIILG